MQQLLKRHWFWPILLAITIFNVSGTANLATPPIEFKLAKDKIAHFLIFGLVATSVLRIPAIHKQGWRGVFFAVLLTSGYGAFDELRQSFTPGREVELADWIADTAGALLASILYYRWHGYRRILEWSVFRARSTEVKAACDSA